MYLPEIGRKIKQLRTQRNLSQAALAKQLGVSKPAFFAATSTRIKTGIHSPIEPQIVPPEGKRPYSKMKRVLPGRKTDVKDAEWIADLLRHGRLKASYIPSRE